MSAYILLGILVILALARPLLYKKVSMTLDHDSGPIFTSVWVLIGLLIVFPFYGGLLLENWQLVFFNPLLLGLLILKGGFLWFLFFNGQVLTRQSLSAAKFVLPTALGLIAIINSFLGEVLETKEWIAALGLCVFGIIFSLRGHLQDLGNKGRFLYFKLVGISIICATLDYLILLDTNWYILLLSTNFLMLMIAFFRKIPAQTWKSALFQKEAMLAGSVFSAGELLKFYLMVSILPMTVVISAQVAVIPVILILSSVIWGERGWKEQFLWGVLSVGLLLLLFL